MFAAVAVVLVSVVGERTGRGVMAGIEVCSSECGVFV